MAKKNDVGYVYIFTNESFREGWVKIGKTQNINQRLTQLDNTSCPLPFDVYATLKTNRYNDAEDFVHDFISHFNQSLRIRPNREYFKVDPEDALDILYKVKKLMNEPNSEIIVYDEKGKKLAKQLEKKHNKHGNVNDENSTTEYKSDISYCFCQLKTLPVYLNCLNSDLTKGVMSQLGMQVNISKTTDIAELERLKQEVKKVEKIRRFHNTHSCAISLYIKYLNAGFKYEDMKKDAELVRKKK